jgi:hypothetical protein
MSLIFLKNYGSIDLGETLKTEERKMAKKPSLTELVENPPAEAVGVLALFQWSENYPYPKTKEDPQTNPYAVFLDLIGYNKENYGENFWSNYDLDFLGISYLATALEEYSNRPTAVIQFIENLHSAEMD